MEMRVDNITMIIRTFKHDLVVERSTLAYIIPRVCKL
jgi:hypothetical protein